MTMMINMNYCNNADNSKYAEVIVTTFKVQRINVNLFKKETRSHDNGLFVA